MLPETENTNETVLVVAAPQSDWVKVAQQHRSDRNVSSVVVLFAHSAGQALVREVRDRVRRLHASGVVLTALACVGVVESDALRELARSVGVPLVS